MKEQHKSSKTREKPPNQFRTPRRTSPAGPSTTKSNRTTAKRERSSESSASSRVNKRTSLPSLRAQPTLTQIDFVTQATASDDDQFDYIDEYRDTTQTTIKQTQLEDGSDKDADFLPPHPARSARITKFKMSEREHDSSERPPKRRTSGMGTRDTETRHGPRRSATPRASVGRKGGRKSLKSTGKRDKTLTQMDFVRRYITIDDDDDVNMGYIQPTEKKPIISETDAGPAEKNGSQRAKLLNPAKRNRRVFEEELDLSTGEPISQPKDAQDFNTGSDNAGDLVSAAPVTPQKPRRNEIPSSQSPESPGLVMITSSQFRGATHSPSKQKQLVPNQPIPPIKEESPEPRRIHEHSQDPRDDSLQTTTNSSNTQDLLNKHIPLPAEHYPSSAPPTDSASEYQPSEANEDSKNGARRRERTVVYETDADTDYGESEDENSNRDSLTPSPKKTRAIGSLVIPLRHLRRKHEQSVRRPDKISRSRPRMIPRCYLYRMCDLALAQNITLVMTLLRPSPRCQMPQHIIIECMQRHSFHMSQFQLSIPRSWLNSSLRRTALSPPSWNHANLLLRCHGRGHFNKHKHKAREIKNQLKWFPSHLPPEKGSLRLRRVRLHSNDLAIQTQWFKLNHHRRRIIIGQVGYYLEASFSPRV
jgi:hypothetical protein